MTDDKPTNTVPLPHIANLSDRDVDSELSALLDEAGPVERRIMLGVARRLVGLGQRQYGRIDLATERRDMAAERYCEGVDLIVYESIDLLRRGRL